MKRDYIGSDVYITATSKEVDELIESGGEVIAMDATTGSRPEKSLGKLVSYVHEKPPNVELMADISTVEEAVIAEKLNFDYSAPHYMVTPMIQGVRRYMIMILLSSKK